MAQPKRNKKDKDKVAIALVLCFCVIALTSIFTIKSNLDKIGNEDGEAAQVAERNPVDDAAGSASGRSGGSGSADGSDRDKTGNDSAKSGTSDAGGRAPTSSEASRADARAAANPPIVDSQDAQRSGSGNPDKMTNPFLNRDGSVTNPYAMSHLIYSVTLDQYMTHCGVDLEAPENAQIVAIAPGTVTAAYMDDRYGASVEVTHDNGFVSVYSNLANLDLVEIGETVDSSRIIGQVGRSGAFEALEPAHLHLEVLKDGVYMDPAEFVDLG